MGDRHHRTGEGVQVVLQNGEGLDVQVVGGLVQQQHIGGSGQHRQQIEPPLLAAGQLADGRPLDLRREEELLQQLGGGEHTLRCLDVVADVLHIVNDPPVPVHVGHLLAEVAEADGLPHLHGTGVGGQSTRYQVEEGGFAAAVGAHDADAVVPQQHAVKVPDHGPVPEGLGDPRKLHRLLP